MKLRLAPRDLLLNDCGRSSLNHRQGCARGFNRRPMTSLRLPPFYHATGGAKMGKRGTAGLAHNLQTGAVFQAQDFLG